MSAKILIVEDEPQMRRAVSAGLRANGFDVLMAESGEDALDTIPLSRPDIILLDLMMPVLDGRETLRRLRELPGGAEAPVVIMSAAISRRVGDDDVVAFLAKPFDLVALLDTVELVLSDLDRTGSRA